MSIASRSEVARGGWDENCAVGRRACGDWELDQLRLEIEALVGGEMVHALEVWAVTAHRFGVLCRCLVSWSRWTGRLSKSSFGTEDPVSPGTGAFRKVYARAVRRK